MYDDRAPLEDAASAQDAEAPANTLQDTDWLARAREGYEQSSDYFDEHYRQQQEKNVANFMSRHPKGSKYHSEAYRSRSRLFRPKTRSAIRGAEANLADAMFATLD